MVFFQVPDFDFRILLSFIKPAATARDTPGTDTPPVFALEASCSGPMALQSRISPAPSAFMAAAARVVTSSLR